MSRFPWLLAAALCLPAALPSSAQSARAVSARVASSMLVTDTVHSAALQGNLYGDSPNRATLVYLPPSYERSPTRRYPVIYLLHGFGSLRGLWDGLLPVQTRMDSLIAVGAVEDMIVVMPDAQNALGGSFYINSAATGNWEDFIAHDLVGYIDGKYRTQARPRSRGIAGLSMGGYGALAVGMRNAGTVYGAIYAMSPCCASSLRALPGPVVDLLAGVRSLSDAARLPQPLRGLLAFAAAASPDVAAVPLFLDLPFVRHGDRIDRIDSTAARWNSVALGEMVPRYAGGLRQLRALAFDVGRNDDEVSPASVMALDTVLTKAGVAHAFELFDGTHMSQVDQRFTQHLLPFFSHAFSSASTVGPMTRRKARRPATRPIR